MLFIFLLGIAAFIVSFGITPLVRNVFLKMGVVDVPDERKVHRNNIPRVGGIAIFVAYAIVYAASALVPAAGNRLFEQPFEAKWWLLGAVAVVFATGLLDDLLTLRPKHKLLGQVLAAVLVWSSGIEIHLFHNMPFGHILSLPLTIFWLVGCSNAFNLIDGLDGLATGAALFATLTMTAAAMLTHNYSLALVTVPLAGCLLAFLCFNFNPASIFLGDCGSLTIGFLLGCFGMIWSEKITTFVGLAAPVMAVSLPLLDTSIAIVRRFLRNRPIFSPDRGHIHHRLLDRGNSVRKTALTLYGVCAVAAALSLLQQSFEGEFGSLAIVLFAILMCFGIQYLGYVEFRVAGRLLSKRVMFGIVDSEIKMQQLEAQLATTTEEAAAFGLIRKTCTDLGVETVFLAGHRDELIEILLASSESQINLPINANRTLVLHGLPQDRPLPVERLSSILRKHFQSGRTAKPAPAFHYRPQEIARAS
ncbi:MAG TPA: MraY family glycosyltransferase [Bryobacteraceae bacterium]|nr:MraY family glycosyltransferase [Bryobacteraceae bacterium]